MGKLSTTVLAIGFLFAVPALAEKDTFSGNGSAATVREVKDALDKFHQGDPDGAIAILDGVLATGNLSDETIAVVHYDRGVIYASKRVWDKAIGDFAIAIEKRPRYGSAYVMLGQTYFSAGDHAKGVAALKTAIAVDPDNADAHSNFANALHGEGHDDEALAQYDRAIALHDSPYAYEGRGLIYLLKGHADKSVTDFTAALNLKPDYFDALVNRAMAYANLGDEKRSLADFDSAFLQHIRGKTILFAQ